MKQINKSYVLSENNVLRTLDYILTSKYSETENTCKDVVQSNWAKNVQDRKWKILIPLGWVQIVLLSVSKLLDTNVGTREDGIKSLIST